MLFATNSTSLIQRLLLKDDSGNPITGVAYDSVSLAVSYNLQSDGLWVSPTLVDGTLGTYLANSWKEIGAGLYQWCPPNAAIVQNSTTIVRATYGANTPQYGKIEARLPAVSSAGAVELDSAVTDQLTKIQDGIAWVLASVYGACANPQDADALVQLTIWGAAYSGQYAGMTSAGVRTAPTLSKV